MSLLNHAEKEMAYDKLSQKYKQQTIIIFWYMRVGKMTNPAMITEPYTNAQYHNICFRCSCTKRTLYTKTMVAKENRASM